MSLPTYDITILETHIDFMGHMNNATYLQIFEEARWDFVTQRGYGFQKIQETKQGPIILDVALKFLKEVRLREKIKVTMELVDYSGKVGHIRQQMLKADGTVAAEAVFAFGLFDMKARKLLEPTPEWKRAVGLD
jgi:YbgC/YbaW family acyl-CoA thioester hydrolase